MRIPVEMNDRNESIKMSPDREQEPVKPRTLRRHFWNFLKWPLIVTCGFLIEYLIMHVGWSPSPDKPLVTISSQVSWATSPLKPNGDVDYVGRLNQQYRVPAEDNSFVDLFRVLGPTTAHRSWLEPFCRELGIDVLPTEGDYLKEMEREKDSSENELTCSVPFAPGEFPVADKWFLENERHLLSIRQAVRKPEFFAPYIGERMMTVLLPHVNDLRLVAGRSLVRSSMLRLGRADIEGAIDDQLASIRLGRHLARQATLVEMLAGYGTEQKGIAAVSQTIFSDKCSDADLQRLSDELRSLGAPTLLDVKHLQNERTMTLDSIVYAGRNGLDAPLLASQSPIESAPNKRPRLFLSSIDWDAVCIVNNEWYDRLDSTLESEDVLQQLAAMKQFESELETLQSEMRPSKVQLKATFGSRATRGRLVGSTFTCMMMPAFRSTLENGIRLQAENIVLQIAIALQRYQLRNGEYPDELIELVPEYLASIPDDPFTGNPLVYKLDESQPFVLYSLGPNAKDDGGIGVEDGVHPNIDLVAVPKIRSTHQWRDKPKPSPLTLKEALETAREIAAREIARKKAESK